MQLSTLRRARGVSFVRQVASLPEHPFARLEHEVRERFALPDGGHALQLDERFLIAALDLLRAAHLRIELPFQLLHLRLELLDVWVLEDVELRRGTSDRVRVRRTSLLAYLCVGHV